MPATKSDLTDTVRQVLVKLFPDHDVSQVSDDADLKDALDIDSLALIDVVLEIERRTGVHVPDEDLGQLTSIDSAVNYVSAHLDKR